MDPFNSDYSVNMPLAPNPLPTRTFNRRGKDTKQDIYEPSNSPSINNARVLYNSFFDNRPSIELTTQNLKENVF